MSSSISSLSSLPHVSVETIQVAAMFNAIAREPEFQTSWRFPVLAQLSCSVPTPTPALLVPSATNSFLIIVSSSSSSSSLSSSLPGRSPTPIPKLSTSSSPSESPSLIPRVEAEPKHEIHLPKQKS